MNLFVAFLLAAAPVPPPSDTARTVATTAVAGDPRVASVDLVSVPGDRLSLRLVDAAGAKVDGKELASVAAVLAVLADRKLAPFWPAVTEFAGPDLVRHRERLLDRTAEGVRAGIPPAAANLRQLAFAPGWTLAARQRFEAMVEAGRLEAGLGEVRAAIARAAAGKSDEDVNAEFSLRIAVANALAAHDRVDEALAFLEAGERSPNTYKEFRRNYGINRAALLVEAGRPAEALRLIDSTLATARKGPIHGDAFVHFAWIRGCALNHLGRAAEAATEYRAVEAALAPELAQVRLRALACLGDDDRFAAELIRQLEAGAPPSSPALMLRSAPFNPFRSARPFARAAARADVRAALDARSRPLPAAMAPALRGWTGE